MPKKSLTPASGPPKPAGRARLPRSPLAKRLRLDTLARLRWLAVTGQTIAVLAMLRILGPSVPLGLCFVAIVASAWLNIVLRLRFPVTTRLGDRAAFALLAYDVAQLSGLLFLTGGLTNPFSILFLAPITIAAVSLPWRGTLGLVLIMIVAAAALASWHRPLPWFSGETLNLPILYVAALWIALALGAVFIAVYASRVAEESRQLSDALAATELVLAREQHLTQLDGLAAAAAHELGTPLATITLVVNEMTKFAAPGTEMAEDLTLLQQEAQRCRSILSKIASLGDEDAALFDMLTLTNLIEEVAHPARDFGVELRVSASGMGPEPTCRRNPGVIYGLGNLVENAVDFARVLVHVRMRWSADTVGLTIEDDGPGFPPDILERLGEPYVTTRGDRALDQDSPGGAQERAGLGLGLFIAKTLLERSGAVVTPGNVAAPGLGAQVNIVWPRTQFERVA